MKATFFHDGPTYIDDEGKYYACVLNDELIDRYFYIADNFCMVVRLRKISNEVAKGHELINHANTTIIETPDLSTFKGLLFSRKEAHRIIEEQVKASDYIIARLPGSVGNIAVKYAIKYRIPFFIEVVGCAWDALTSHSLRGKLVAPFMWFLTRRSIKKAPYATYVTKKYLQKRYPNYGYNIYCSDVVLAKYEESVLETRIKKIKEKGKQHFLLGTLAGVDIPYKGQRYVIEAIARLKITGQRFEYLIIGAGNQESLKRLAEKLNVKDQVHFTGSVPHEKVFILLDSIDIYIQPSRTEGMPRALIEAMSRGCLCIGSEVGGIPELLPKEYLFRKGNVNDLTALFLKIKENDLLEQAKINFEKAKEFNDDILEKRRKKFMIKFAKESFNTGHV